MTAPTSAGHAHRDRRTPPCRTQLVRRLPGESGRPDRLHPLGPQLKRTVGRGASGWACWSPVSAIAIATHVIGGAGLSVANGRRLAGQQGAASNTIVKTILTGAATGSIVYSGVLGAHLAADETAPVDSATVSGPRTPDRVGRS